MDVGRQSEDRLLFMFTEAIRELEAVRRLRDPRSAAADGRRCSGEEPGGGEGDGAEGGRGGTRRTGSSEGGEEEGEEEGVAADEEERRCMQKVLGVLRELSVSHSERVTAWREALRRCAHMLANWPLEGSNHHHPVRAGTGDYLIAATRPLTFKGLRRNCKLFILKLSSDVFIYSVFYCLSDLENKCFPCSDSVSNAFISIQVDIQHITEKLSTIISKLDAEILKLHAEGTTTKPQEIKDVNKDENKHQNISVPLEVDSGQKVDDEDDGNSKMPSSDAQQESDLRSCSSDCNDLRGKEEELVSGSQESSSEGCFSQDSMEERGEKVEGKSETNSKWITVG